jgi:hypothetical protein
MNSRTEEGLDLASYAGALDLHVSLSEEHDAVLREEDVSHDQSA